MFTRYPCSLFKFLRKLGFLKDIKQPSKPYVPKPYHTHIQITVLKYIINILYLMP